MRITFIKENRDAGTESISTCDTAAFITRIKSETKPGHVGALRTMLEYTIHGSGGTYGHIDKLPAYAPLRSTDATARGERRMKRYNGIVLLEVGGLSACRSGTGERTGGAPSPNLCSFRRKQRTEREDMGAVCLTERQTSAAGRRNQPVPCACRMAGTITNPASVSRNVERALACRYFPHDAGRNALFCPRCRTFLSRTTRDDARRADIQPTKVAENNPLKRLQPGFDSSQTSPLLFESRPGSIRWTKWRTGSATGMIFTRCSSP